MIANVSSLTGSISYITLSLYATATQNYWRRGLALGNAKINQHVGIFLRYLTIGIGHVYFMYISCIFHVVCASFSALATRKLARQIPVEYGL